MSITICNFSNVYGNQPYLEGLRLSGKATWLDLSGISGTDCYCDDEAVAAIKAGLNKAGVVDAQGIHFIDNGNFHYMSKLWTDMIQEPFTLVVFDHHPDMQEPRFGDILSCGGWVKKVLKENKFINNVVIIGAADHLVKEIRSEIASHPTGARNDKGAESNEQINLYIAEANQSCALRNDNITFICESEIANHTFHIPHSTSTHPLYISIDKDVLSPTDAATNWDQGSLRLEQMKAFIDKFAKNHKIIGVDICGERARDFSGDEHHSIQEADTLNNELNRDLLDFITQQIARHAVSP